MKVFGKQLIAIEGPDRVGKATQSKMLVEKLKKFCFTAVRKEVPFNDFITHRVIYWMLHNGYAKRFPNAFQFVQFVNKFLFQFTVLLYLRLTYDYVILDRWSLSAVVYGDATGVNPAFNRFLYSLLVRPDLTLVLEGSRFNRNDKADTYETDTTLQAMVKSGYRAWAESHPVDHRIINNIGTPQQVQRRIMKSTSRDEDSDKFWTKE
jgi:thymidylate kinase